MAVEKKRGCGYRKVNGIYLVMEPAGFSCDRLPLELNVCSCCGEGIKFSRGFTWISPFKLFEGDHVPPCICNENPLVTGRNFDDILPSVLHRRCPVCQPSYHFISDDGADYSKQAGLMWIGEKFYSTESFTQEAAELGISKRISQIPHGFKIGETWIFLAHKKAIKNNVVFDGKEIEKPKAGIFMAFKPARIEKIVLRSEFLFWKWFKVQKDCMAEQDFEALLDAPQNKDQVEIYTRLQRDIDRGLTIIPVPDDDPDHNPTADPKYIPPPKQWLPSGSDQAQRTL